MGFAFSQTQNLSQRADTRSGIIPIKWGFSSDVDNLDIGSQLVGSVRTSALMNIEATGEKSCFGNFTSSSVSSGNNETSNLTTQTEANWRTLEINPNAKTIELYIITRAGNGGNVNQYDGLNCSQAGNGRRDCCDPNQSGACSCGCVCDGQGCGTGGQCTEDTCSTTYTCCPNGGASGGDAGYYKVNIDVENLPQEALWVYLAQFNGNSGSSVPANDCNDTIKVEIYNSTLPFGQGGFPNMYPEAPGSSPGGLYADFKVYPGQTGNDTSTGVRGSCTNTQSCTECDGGPCLPCPSEPSPGDDSNYDTPYINPSVASSITVTVTEVTADAFWGAAGNNGWLQQEFGWGAGTPSIPGDFVSKNYGNLGGTKCVPDITVTPDPSGDPPSAGACSCEGETFDTNGSTDVHRTSGQLIGFVVS